MIHAGLSWKWTRAGVGAAWAFVAGLSAFSPDIVAKEASADIAIIHARIISPPDSIIGDGTVLIAGDRIAYVGPNKSSIHARHIIDANGRTLIPGLMDVHAHLGARAFDSEQAYQEFVRTEMTRQLGDYLRYGFTTLLSVGDYWPGILQVRDQLARGVIRGPRLLISGPLISPAGGHGIGDDPTCAAVNFCAQHGYAHAVDSEVEARRFVKELADAKVDGIKIALQAAVTPENTDGAYQVNGSFGQLAMNTVTEKFPPGVLEALIDEAHRSHLPVRAHTGTIATSIDVINAGVDALVHGPGTVDGLKSDKTLEDLVKIAKQKDIPLTTTAVISRGIVKDYWGEERFYLDGRTEIIPFLVKHGNPERVSRDIRYFTAAGITLAFGSDNGRMPSVGDAEKAEFRVLYESGVAPMKILEMATGNAAKFIYRQNDLGKIEVGKIADMAIVAGDPLRDMDFIDRVDLVIKSGKIVHDYWQKNISE